jgi:hypothetical protein
MPYQQKPGQTNLFSNRDKKEERHPDFKGECQVEINGHLYPLDIAMWRKESERAGEFFSVSIRLKGERQPRPSNGCQHVSDYVNQHGTAFDDEGVPPDDKDIPF